MKKPHDPTLAGDLLALMQARELARTEEEKANLQTLVSRAMKVALRVSVPTTGRVVPPMALALRTVADALAHNTLDVPHRLDALRGSDVLCVGVRQLRDFVAAARASDPAWTNLPAVTRSARTLRKSMTNAGLLLVDERGMVMEVERTINRARLGHMVCIVLPRLNAYLAGLDSPAD